MNDFFPAVNIFSTPKNKMPHRNSKQRLNENRNSWNSATKFHYCRIWFFIFIAIPWWQLCEWASYNGSTVHTNTNRTKCVSFLKHTRWHSLSLSHTRFPLILLKFKRMDWHFSWINYAHALFAIKITNISRERREEKNKFIIRIIDWKDVHILVFIEIAAQSSSNKIIKLKIELNETRIHFEIRRRAC